ncbi:hypothetical protein PsorP6_002390 [Peronosclerospora sorghi]|uniref:Uncharacterized protein n=1 Tax=Peronosclerospora sorghi TaxID=230839 RepID=A0ACC0WWU1_9STRA|nr:hypothetical protein PsorP6_002390 [Peronosclerospora sorghi]
MVPTAELVGEFGDVNASVSRATEEEYDASDSSSDHGSVSVECGSNVGLDDNHSTADDEGGVNEEEKHVTATAAAPEADDPSSDGSIAETPEPERVVVMSELGGGAII